MELHHICSHISNNINNLQRNHLLPPISMNINPFRHNPPTMLTISANQLDIATERGEDRFRTTYEHHSGLMNISAVIQKSNFELEATIESRQGGAMPPRDVTPVLAVPRSLILPVFQQRVLWTSISNEESVLETDF